MAAPVVWPAVGCHERGHRHTVTLTSGLYLGTVPPPPSASPERVTGHQGRQEAAGGRRRPQEAAGEEGEKGDSKAFEDDFFTLDHTDS